MASGEWVVVIVLPRKDGTGEVNVTVRGMMPDGLEMRMRPEHPAKLVEGRWFQTGQREVVVSKSIRDRFTHANIGDTMEFGKGSWKVVGVFDAGGSAYESEVWGDVNQMASDFDRQGDISSAYLRATDPISAEALKNRVSDDQRLKLEGVLETEYYAKQTSSGTPIKVIGNCSGLHHGDRVDLRGHEYNVRGGGISRPRDRDAARDWIFAAGNSDIIRAGIFAAGVIGSGRGNSADAAVQRNGNWHVERRDVQRSGVRLAHHAEGSDVRRSVCVDHGICGRAGSGVACGAAEYFDRVARLER